MIGNAVPVNLAKFLASTILEYEEEKLDKKQIQQNLFYNEVSFLIPETTLHRMCC